MKNSLMLFTLILLGIAGAKNMQLKGKAETVGWMNQYPGRLLSGRYSTAAIGVDTTGTILSVNCMAAPLSPTGEACIGGCILDVPLAKIIIQPFRYTKVAQGAYRANFQTSSDLPFAGCQDNMRSISVWASDPWQLERFYNGVIHLAKLNGAKSISITVF